MRRRRRRISAEDRGMDPRILGSGHGPPQPAEGHKLSASYKPARQSGLFWATVIRVAGQTEPCADPPRPSATHRDPRRPTATHGGSCVPGLRGETDKSQGISLPRRKARWWADLRWYSGSGGTGIHHRSPGPQRHPAAVTRAATTPDRLPHS